MGAIRDQSPNVMINDAIETGIERPINNPG